MAEHEHFFAKHSALGPLKAIVFCSLCQLELVWTGAFYVCRECDPNISLPKEANR